MESEKKGQHNSKDRQTTLDGKFLKLTSPNKFTHDGILHLVAQFIACDDQVGLHNAELPNTLCAETESVCQSLAVANKAVFHNCLVGMRPKSTQKDMPSTHDVSMYIHNKFVCRLEELKHNIIVSQLQRQCDENITDDVGCTQEKFMYCGWVVCRHYMGIVPWNDSPLDSS